MTVARDIMMPSPQHVNENDTLADAARLMAELDVGSVPICGDDGMLQGMATDRDIVVKCLARGGDPRNAPAGSLADGRPVAVSADDEVWDVVETMCHHRIRLVPVIENDDLVGVIGQAEVALGFAPDRSGPDVPE
nr:CBS domain-containing protein [Microbacterium bovistercoris]